jgi:RNA processing factor Prp31
MIVSGNDLEVVKAKIEAHESRLQTLEERVNDLFSKKVTKRQIILAWISAIALILATLVGPVLANLIH